MYILPIIQYMARISASSSYHHDRVAHCTEPRRAVEWRHHRHLVHEAEAGLRTEIQHNADGLKDTLADIRTQGDVLKSDVGVLKQIIKDHKSPKDSHVEINFHIRGFDNVSWKTAQSTGALSYMSYASTKEYTEIYDTQDAIDVVQRQAARDAIFSLAPFMNVSEKDGGPNAEEAVYIKQHIEILQGQLLLLNALVTSLDGGYKKFLTAHTD